ncbi:aldo/keto reductase [Psychromonas antarctica]|jgi:aryl-alcohol dehydrogenase-like predicted oxidoreductase|uniref:aldo/keto reductase n=1 Tax=Psychromonas antarctica TaxID=67573 RepID=UPI001EE8CC46|nr:aldo/keto reductase [Psychromonas antarctica]MCG6200515.1 aldo/keto reductase [Psychromonas antarctica]
MQQRNFGITGFDVSAIGYGAGTVGDGRLAEKQAERILNQVLDMGINFIDTAKGYGLSEQRIGQYISHRRDEFKLSTKVGYGIEGKQDWTYDCIIAGIDQALTTMKTDVIDVVHLHSCPASVLQDGQVIDALDEAKRKGKVKAIAYSGENEDLKCALSSNRFDSIMASLNFCDQRIIHNQLVEAKQQGLGMIAKRPIANAPWRFDTQPHGDYAEAYWLRRRKMALEFGMSELELALRFTVFTYGVDTAIVGSVNVAHLQKNIEMIKAGPLPNELVQYIHARFRECDDHWIGQI